jgi:hypothetical protein
MNVFLRCFLVSLKSGKKKIGILKPEKGWIWAYSHGFFGVSHQES